MKLMEIVVDGGAKLYRILFSFGKTYNIVLDSGRKYNGPKVGKSIAA